MVPDRLPATTVFVSAKPLRANPRIPRPSPRIGQGAQPSESTTMQAKKPSRNAASRKPGTGRGGPPAPSTPAPRPRRSPRQGAAPEAAPASPVATGQRQAHKRVLQPDAQQPKLHKLLAQAGVGSRLEMEALIAQGRITVNDQPAHVGQRVQHGDQIKINGKPLRLRVAPPAVRVLAYQERHLRYWPPV